MENKYIRKGDYIAILYMRLRYPLFSCGQRWTFALLCSYYYFIDTIIANKSSLS